MFELRFASQLSDTCVVGAHSSFDQRLLADNQREAVQIFYNSLRYIGGENDYPRACSIASHLLQPLSRHFHLISLLGEGLERPCPGLTGTLQVAKDLCQFFAKLGEAKSGAILYAPPCL